MRNQKKNGLVIGLSAQGITLLRTSGWFKKRSTVLADREWPEESSAPFDRIATELRSMLTEFDCKNFSAKIVLSDALVRLWRVTPPQNAARLSDCQAATALRFQALYGESLTDWELVADWDAQKPFFACAMPHSLLQLLKTVAHEHQITILEIVPRFIAALNRWRSEIHSTSWFGLLHEDVLTIGAMHQQRLWAVRAAPLPAEAWSNKDWLLQHIQREALLLNLDMPPELQLCGPIPAHWINQTLGSLLCTQLEARQYAPATPVSAGVELAHAGMRRRRG